MPGAALVWRSVGREAGGRRAVGRRARSGMAARACGACVRVPRRRVAGRGRRVRRACWRRRAGARRRAQPAPRQEDGVWAGGGSRLNPTLLPLPPGGRRGGGGGCFAYGAARRHLSGPPPSPGSQERPLCASRAPAGEPGEGTRHGRSSRGRRAGGLMAELGNLAAGQRRHLVPRVPFFALAAPSSWGAGQQGEGRPDPPMNSAELEGGLSWAVGKA